jgi:hypothetical protein
MAELGVEHVLELPLVHHKRLGRIRRQQSRRAERSKRQRVKGGHADLGARLLAITDAVGMDTLPEVEGGSTSERDRADRAGLNALRQQPANPLLDCGRLSRTGAGDNAHMLAGIMCGGMLHRLCCLNLGWH